MNNLLPRRIKKVKEDVRGYGCGLVCGACSLTCGGCFGCGSLCSNVCGGSCTIWAFNP